MKLVSRKAYRTGNRAIYSLVLFSCAISGSPAAHADGLLVRLRSVKKGHAVSVLTSERILSNEQTELEILVQNADFGQFIRDAAVTVDFRPETSHHSKVTPEYCGSARNSNGSYSSDRIQAFSVVASPKLGTAGIYFSAPVTFPDEGRWLMDVRVHHQGSQVSASGILVVSEARTRWQILWPLVAAPFAMIAVFGANQWIRMGRLRLAPTA